MKFRNMAGVFGVWCLLVGCLLLVGQGCEGASVDKGTAVGEFKELSEYGSFSPEDLCQSLCGECSCRGTLVSEDLCHCSCEFSPDSEGGRNCTSQVRRLCEQMDVQCDFNGPEEDYVREPRGCHSMSCYEKHHEHEAGEYGGYHGGDGYGYEDEGHGHGGKQLICCKDKKHKEKKHKHKKHKKFHHKHMKFHVVIKGKIPEKSCHEDHEGEGHYGDYDEHEGYRASRPDKHPINPAHAPMDVTVWTNRQKLAKKQPFRRPFQQHHHQHQQHYAPAYPPSYPAEARGKSAEPPSPGPRPEPRPEPMHPPQESGPPPPPQEPPSLPPPPPPEPESPPVTPFPERPLTPPPNLYDGAPIGPKKQPPQQPPKAHKFSPPSRPASPRPPPPPPPPPSHFSRPSPPMITVDPPPRRIESSRSFAKPSSDSSCPFDSYDFNYYHPPPSYHVSAPSAPPPPPPSSYRSYSSYSSSYDPSYPSSHYHPHAQYENSKHYSAYDEPVDYSTYDDSPGDSREYYPDSHGVDAFSDNEIEDWPEFPSRSPSDIFTYNQIVSRQIFEADRARLYMTKPFQPTPRPLRDEFEPPTGEVGPVMYESFGYEQSYDESFGYDTEKGNDMDPPLTPPPDAFIPPVPPPAIPVEFPEAEHEPAMFVKNSEEALYPQPTPPPHYLLAKEAGSMSSFGFDQSEYSPYWEPSRSEGYGRSATGPSHYRAASSRSSSQHNRKYY